MRPTALAVLLALPFLLGQGAPPPQPISTTAVIEWEHSGLDLDGNPEQLASSFVALTGPAADLRLAGTIPLATITRGAVMGINTAALSELLAGRPPGNYRLWVRVSDQAGNLSAWAGPLDVALDASAPAGPSNLRIRVTVTVEINP